MRSPRRLRAQHRPSLLWLLDALVVRMNLFWPWGSFSRSHVTVAIDRASLLERDLATILSQVPVAAGAVRRAAGPLGFALHMPPRTLSPVSRERLPVRRRVVRHSPASATAALDPP